MSFHFSFSNFVDFSFFLIDVRGKGREKERNGEKHGYERNIYRLPPIQCLRLGIQPGTWVRALTGHGMLDPLVPGKTLQSTEPSSQGEGFSFKETK